MKAEDVWSDFDEIVDIDAICPISLTQRVALVNRVSSACCMQMINLLYELRKTDILELHDLIEERYIMWRDIHSKLLKL